MQNSLDSISSLAGIAATFIFAALLVGYLVRYFSEAEGIAPFSGKYRPKLRKPATQFWKVIL